jgi:hypothetical protein
MVNMSNENMNLKMRTIKKFQKKLGEVLAVEGATVENFRELEGQIITENDSKMSVIVKSIRDGSGMYSNGTIGFMTSGIPFSAQLELTIYTAKGKTFRSNGFGLGFGYISASRNEEKVSHTKYNVILDEISLTERAFAYREENMEKHYGLMEWRFKEMYRRAYPSIDITQKREWSFQDDKGEYWLEPTHFLIRSEDYDELFKIEGNVLVGINFVMNSPSSFHLWKNNKCIAQKIVEIFYFNNYSDEQREKFVTAWYNLATEYEDFDWAYHFESLKELIDTVTYGDRIKIELPDYVYFEGAVI